MDPKETEGAAFEKSVQDLYSPAADQEDDEIEDEKEEEEEEDGR